MELFKNSSWIMSSQIITSIFAFIWVILIARYLGVSDFGILTFATTFTTLMYFFMDLGICTYTTRDLSWVQTDPSPDQRTLSTDKENLSPDQRDLFNDLELASKYLGNGIPLKFLLSLFSFLATIVILFILGKDSLTIEVTLIFAIQMIFLNLGNLFNAAFQAYGKMKFQAIGILVNSSLLLVGTLVVIFTNLGIYSIAMVYLIANIGSLIYLYQKSNSEIVPLKLQFDLSFWKESVKKAIPFGLTGIFGSIFLMIDSLMLFVLKGSTAVGIYSSAFKIISVFTTLYMVYNFVIFPLMSNLYKNSADMLKISYEKSVKYLLMIILPIAVGILFYSEEVILLIYGSQFALASSVLQILIWNVVFYFINGASTLLLNSSNKEVSVTKINAVACVFNFVMNFILINYYNYIGASIAAVMTGLLICVIMTYLVIKSEYKPSLSLGKDLLKIIFSSLILAEILSLTNLPLIFAIPIAIITYLIVITLTKTLDDTDIGIIKEILGKN